jgi:hypothetical protein
MTFREASAGKCRSCQGLANGQFRRLNPARQLHLVGHALPYLCADRRCAALVAWPANDCPHQDCTTGGGLQTLAAAASLRLLFLR